MSSVINAVDAAIVLTLPVDHALNWSIKKNICANWLSMGNRFPRGVFPLWHNISFISRVLSWAIRTGGRVLGPQTKLNIHCFYKIIVYCLLCTGVLQ